jgi:hypothetical protein
MEHGQRPDARDILRSNAMRGSVAKEEMKAITTAQRACWCWSVARPPVARRGLRLGWLPSGCRSSSLSQYRKCVPQGGAGRVFWAVPEQRSTRRRQTLCGRRIAASAGPRSRRRWQAIVGSAHCGSWQQVQRVWPSSGGEYGCLAVSGCTCLRRTGRSCYFGTPGRLPVRRVASRCVVGCSSQLHLRFEPLPPHTLEALGGSGSTPRDSS